MRIPVDIYPFLTAGTIKMLMERVYDAAFKTDLAQKIQKLGVVSKSSMILAFGVVSFFAFRNIKDDSFLKKVAKEVGADSWSEIGKRFFNGFHDLVSDLEKTAKTQEERATIGLLRNLDSRSFTELLREFVKTLDSERIQPEEFKRAVLTPSALTVELEKATTALKNRREVLRKRREGR